MSLYRAETKILPESQLPWVDHPSFEGLNLQADYSKPIGINL